MKLEFSTVLTLIFITLKLMGYITWSWWWVLSPLWIGFALVVFILTVALLVQVRTNKSRRW